MVLKLHVVQAFHGDCFLLEYGTRRSEFLLIDGGPEDTYDSHLRDVLAEIHRNGHDIARVILTHVDGDHVQGLLKFFENLKSTQQRDSLEVGGLWHNSFSGFMARHADEYRGFRDLTNPRILSEMGIARAVRTIDEGDYLTKLATNLDLSLNEDFGGKLIASDTAQVVSLGNIKITILGPTTKQLNDLREQWYQWLRLAKMSVHNPRSFAASRSTVPNLSSIMFLVEDGENRILFTGDGNARTIIEELETNNKMNDNGRLHVDILKIPHHGSRYNVNKTFFKRIIAKKYIISANRRHPSKKTLEWLVQSIKENDQGAEIVVTNMTKSIREFLQAHAPDSYDYRLTLLPEENHSIEID